MLHWDQKRIRIVAEGSSSPSFSSTCWKTFLILGIIVHFIGQPIVPPFLLNPTQNRALTTNIFCYRYYYCLFCISVRERFNVQSCTDVWRRWIFFLSAPFTCIVWRIQCELRDFDVAENCINAGRVTFRVRAKRWQGPRGEAVSSN